MALPLSTPEKLKIPGEKQASSATNPTFASPNIQTSADVRQSQAVAGKSPSPNTSQSAETPKPLPVIGASGQAPTENPQATQTPAPTTPAPKMASTTPVSSVPGLIASQTTTSIPTMPAASGAPPGVPNTTLQAQSQVAPQAATAPPAVGLAPTMKSTQGKTAAESSYLVSQNETAQKLYEAALAYNGGPTGALEQDQEKAKEGLQSATNVRGNAGTIESSLYGEDKTKIATEEATSNLKAEVVYQEAVNNANQLLAKAQVAYQQATEQEKREIAEAAERKEAQEAATAASGPPPNPPTPATNPGAVRTNEGIGPGGVQKHTEKLKSGGFVRVG